MIAYKGFEKGIRQVYMLMPKVTGEQFSIYRIRRLMNKYGIRTTIRRPSKNRKAMKELIARNKKANLLMRKFKLHRPNEVRLTDVTYLDYGDGRKAYGSASVCTLCREYNGIAAGAGIQPAAFCTSGAAQDDTEDSGHER